MQRERDRGGLLEKDAGRREGSRREGRGLPATELPTMQREREREIEGDCRLEERQMPRGMGLYGREISEREREQRWRGNEISYAPPTGFEAFLKKMKNQNKNNFSRQLVVPLLCYISAIIISHVVSPSPYI
jgi:hypothetical protein